MINKTYLSNFLRGSNQLLLLLEYLDDLLNGLLGTSSEVHRVAAGSDVLDPLRVNCTSENGRCSGAVTGHLIGLRRDLLDESGDE
jgi:hypothetical protein